MSIQTPFFTEQEIKESQVEPFSEREWREEGRALAKVHDHRQWDLGDWLNRGVDALTKRKALQAAIKITGQPESTLWDYARAARAFQTEYSRRRELHWSLYKAVSIEKLSAEDREELLEAALIDPEGEWSHSRMLTAVKNKVKANDIGSAKPGQRELQGRKVQVRLNAETYSALKRLARQNGQSVGVYAGRLLAKSLATSEQSAA